MADRMLAAETRRTGRGAVQEVIGQGILERITQDLQLGREVTLIEELLRRMGGSGPAAYGYDEVAAAVQYGAVSDILVIDTIVCEENINSLLESADTMRAKITVFSSEFEPGKQLAAIGELPQFCVSPYNKKIILQMTLQLLKVHLLLQFLQVLQFLQRLQA